MNVAFSDANAIICESDGYSEARLQNSIKLFINVGVGEHRAINLETLQVEIEQKFSPEAKKIVRTASWLDCYEPLSNVVHDRLLELRKSFFETHHENEYLVISC